MPHFRFGALAALALTVLLAACSTDNDLATVPNLESQFGTRGHDTVTDLAYGKALSLYTVGTWNDENTSRIYDYGGPRDAFIRRYDRNGNLVWEDFFDIEPAYSYEYDNYIPQLDAQAVAVDGSGNAIVAWSGTYSESVRFDYLTKYSPAGKRLWRIYTNNAIKDLAVDSTGNIYAVTADSLIKYTPNGAQSWSRTNSGNPNGVTVSSTNNIYIVRNDGAVVKYNAAGTQLWLKTGALDGYAEGTGYYEYSQNPGYKIAAGLSDELYVTLSHADGEGWECDAGLYHEYRTVRIYKLTSVGTQQWVKNVAQGVLSYGQDCGGELFESPPGGVGIAADNKGNAYVVGFQNTRYNDQDGFIAKYSRTGVLNWKKAFVSLKDDSATAVATLDGSEVFVGGITNGSLGHRQLGNGDAVLREVNSSGNMVWSR